MSISKESFSVFLINPKMKSASKESIRKGNQWQKNDPDHFRNEKFASKCTFDEVVEIENIIAEDLAKPVIFIMKYTLPFIDTITYNSQTRRFVTLKGTMWRKGFCILLEILILLRLGINTMPLITDYSKDKENGMTTLAKGAYFVFLSFYIVIYYLYWTTAKYFCEMFNHALSLSERICLKERSPSRIQLVKRTVNASWIFVTLFIFFTMLVHGLEYFKANTSNHVNLSHGVSNSSKLSRYKVDFTNIYYHHDFILVQIILAAIGCMNIGSGMMSFLFLGVLAIFFRQLILLYYWKIEAMDELGLHFIVPHEVRTFNKIGKIIDTFNQHYGLMNLVGSAVAVTYISTSAEQAFSGLQNILRAGTGLHLLLSYLPLLATSLMIAEVSRVAGSFAGIIKDQYGKFTKECGDAAESLCGIAIVHYDLATSNIGFKGLGFFTVSYQFITTILSLIVTYSIVIVQLFPNDDLQTTEPVN